MSEVKIYFSNNFNNQYFLWGRIVNWSFYSACRINIGRINFLYLRIVNVIAVHQIGIGLFIFVLWRLKLDNDSNKKIFLANSVLGGTILLVALFNDLYRGGGPPIPILVLIISATLLGIYGTKKGTN